MNVPNILYSLHVGMNNDNKDQEAVSMEKWKRESSQ
jgi:hypothetical protein